MLMSIIKFRVDMQGRSC